jgi:hypothetical protein
MSAKHRAEPAPTWFGSGFRLTTAAPALFGIAAAIAVIIIGGGH